jgi:hypothetical protein
MRMGRPWSEEFCLSRSTPRARQTAGGKEEATHSRSNCVLFSDFFNTLDDTAPLLPPNAETLRPGAG